jgi:dipeptidyl aminopeptidase/acylaminoacyl peptidase
MNVPRKRAFGLVLSSSLFLLFGGITARAAAPALEAYGSLPKFDEVKLSPSGARLALVQTDGSQRAVAVVQLPEGKPISGARVGEEKLRDLQWADEDHLLIMRSVTGNIQGQMLRGRGEFMNVLAFDVRTGSTTSLPVQSPGASLFNAVLTPPMVRRIDGHTVLFFTCYRLVLDRGKGLAPVLIRYDLDSGMQREIRTGSPTLQDWFVDDAGHVSALVDYDPRKQEWKVSTVLSEEGELRSAQTGTSAVEVPTVMGFGADANTLLVRMLEDDVVVYRTLTVGTGALGENSVVPKDAGPLFDEHSHRLIGSTAVADSRVYHFSDPARQSAWESVTKLFAGSRVQLVSTSADFKKLVVRVDGRTEGLNYRLADLATGRVSLIGDVYAGIKTPNETRAITYNAADGLPIRAYLTLPEGRPPSRLPLVVLVHGGPAARDTADFDWWAQAFASQGYAVLQPNYRGSSLGYKFVAAGFGEWGRKMQTDVSDGVKHLAEQGIADPARVCIAGASYGGYAALAGVSLQSNIYRCAISVAGPGNLQQMLRFESNTKSDATQRYWDRFMGVKGANDSALDKISPSEHIDAITVPVLLIHGKDDLVVPYEQSESMAGALKRAGKRFEFVTLKREDHWLSRPETRTQMLQSSVEFLRRHNPPD